MKKRNRTIPSSSSTKVLITLVVIAITLLLLKNSIFDNKKNIMREGITTHSSTPLSQRSDQQTKTTSSELPQPALPQAPPTPPPVNGAESSPTKNSCEEVSSDILHFLTHLEHQQYIKSYALEEPIQERLSNIIAKILNTPPANEKETDDLSIIINNTSHFIRILGIKDLLLLKDIVTNEQPAMEQQFASLFAWSTLGEKCRANSALKLQLPLSKTYEYAAFFLNTLGGQSYLARRDSTLRTLLRYYSVLIIHQAIQQSINRYNINLPYHLEAVIRDITNSSSLANQALYLDTLQKIKQSP